MYTVMDEAGTRTLLNMGLQPATFPGVPPERLPILIESVDGLLLGGSATHVHPSLYGEAEEADVLCYDRDRDAVAQPLLRLAIAKRVPLISFCRGCHDFNVAMGGSLHQSLRKRGGGVVHWEDPEHETIDQQYADRHWIETVAGGELERMTGQRRMMVSSLHSQGVKELGHDLVAEAHADDGLVEAFRWHDESLFAWGFQFHPEWGWRCHECYARIMNRFVRACWERYAARTGHPVVERELVA
jgi:putative glutamine amidotransferase